MAENPTPGIDPQAKPSGTGCAECLGGDGPGWWVKLRRCAQCGQIGCCDSSPARHATRHADQAGHPILTTFEPGEDWFYDVGTAKFFFGPPLAPPTARPEDQPSPGPAGKVPADWRSQIHQG